MVIRALEKLGLAWDVVRVSPERQAQQARRLRCRERTHRPAAQRARRRPFPSARSTVELWDGTRCPPTNGAGPDVPRRARRDALGARAARPGPARARPRLRVAARSRSTTSTRRSRCSTSWQPPPIDRATRARLALAAVRACGPLRAAAPPAAELRPRGPAPQPSSATRARCATTTTSRNEFFALFLGESMTYSLRDLLARRDDARGGAGDQARAGLHEARAAAGRARARRRLRLGQLRDPRRRASTASRSPASRCPSRRPTLARQRVGGARPRRPRRHPRGGLPRAARRAVRRGREHRHGRARRRAPTSTSTRAQLARVLQPGGRLLNHGIARLRHGDPEAGPFSERYVFPDARAAAPVAHPARARARRASRPTTSRASGRLRGRCATGRGGSTSTSTRRCGSPARSACASGGSTCAPPGAASRAASCRSTRSRPADPAQQARRDAWRPLRHRSARPYRRSRQRPRWPPHARPQARHRGRAGRAT